MSTLTIFALCGCIFLAGMLVGFFTAALCYVGRDEYEDVER